VSPRTSLPKPKAGSFDELVLLAEKNIEEFKLFDDRDALAWFLGWCHTESALNPYAMRYEPNFRYLFPPDDKPPRFTTEWFAQKTSWGILQIMGAVARERMFDARFLAELCDLKVNLRLASEYLAELRGRSDGTWNGALASYNGGLRGNRKAPYRNQGYVEKVERHTGKYKRISALR
jgi:hypothetical protein